MTPGGTAYTLGLLSEHPDGSWRLVSVGLYSERHPTVHLGRSRYVEIWPPITGDDFAKACDRASEVFSAMGLREAFSGVELYGRLGSEE